MQTISEGECGDKQNVCNDNNRRIFSARTQVTLLYFYTFIPPLPEARILYFEASKSAIFAILDSF